MAIDLGDRADAQRLAEIVVTAIDPGITIVLASSGADIVASPRRPVVRLETLERVASEGGRR